MPQAGLDCIVLSVQGRQVFLRSGLSFLKGTMKIVPVPFYRGIGQPEGLPHPS